MRGVPDPSLVSPDTWEHDFALVSREGNDEIQLALFRDYRNHRPLYPLLHEFLDVVAGYLRGFLGRVLG